MHHYVFAMEKYALLPPDIDQIEALAIQAVNDLPETYRKPAMAVALRIEDFASDEMMHDLGITDPFELTGLYEGVPLTERSVMDQPMQPDAIWLFRRPILDEWVDRGTVPLADLVAHVLIHELAHHFGWSDEDIAEIAPWQD
jgi:predicted Zn-dependent protease with MMP-like domain